jgi:hypothetical protein
MPHSARRIAAHEILYQHGQHRNDHAESQHVDEHRNEYEGQCGFAGRGIDCVHTRESSAPGTRDVNDFAHEP